MLAETGDLDLLIAEIWLAFCAALVFLMQPGFMCLESGLARWKDSIDAAMKNIADFLVVAMIYWAVGYGLMFGKTHGGWYGNAGEPFAMAKVGDWSLMFFLFQTVYCGTSMTIASGASAERMRFRPYLILCIVMGGFAYPIFGHWAWAGLEQLRPQTIERASALIVPIADSVVIPTRNLSGWLGRQGFIDIAGSTVVHSFGAWVALAAAIYVKPRPRRFDADAPGDEDFHGHNLPMASLGLFLLWFSWFGFTGGRALGSSARIPRILINTLLASLSGGLTGMYLFYGHSVRGKFSVRGLINGVLAGLVAICASCNFVTPAQSVFVGFVGASAMYLGVKILRRLEVDDVVDAFPIHGCAGIAGTLLVPFMLPQLPVGTLPEGATTYWLCGIQLLGILVCAVVAFGGSYGTLAIISFVARRFPILTVRLTDEEQERGLNEVEYGVRTMVSDLKDLIESTERSGDFNVEGVRLPNDGPGAMGTIRSFVVSLLHRFQRRRLFLLGISHDLGTPLQTADLDVRQLERILGNEPSVPQEAFIKIQSLQRNLAQVIQWAKITSLYSRVEAEKEDIELVEEDLFAILQTVIANASEWHANENPEIEFEFDQTGALPGHVKMEKRLWTAIVMNLIGNAFRYTSRGQVTLQLEHKEDMLTTIVTDTGVGLSEEDRRHCFDLHDQVDEQGHPASTGTGLAICKIYTRLLNGEIGVESELGKGSRFWFSVPCPACTSSQLMTHDIGRQLDTAIEDSDPKVDSSADDCLDGIHILYLEDNNKLRRDIAYELIANGAYVETAMTGEQAIIKITNDLPDHPFDIGLFDLRLQTPDGLPGMDGRETLKKLRSQKNTTPIVAFSAYTYASQENQLIEDGFVGYITKPIEDWKAFVSKIRRICDTGSGREVGFGLKTQQPPEIEVAITETRKNAEQLRHCVLHWKWKEASDVAHGMTAIAKHSNCIGLGDALQTVQQLIEPVLSWDPEGNITNSELEMVHEIQMAASRCRDIALRLVSIRSQRAHPE